VVSVRHRQRPKQDGIHQRKHRRVRADAETKGEHDDRRDQRVAAQHAQCVVKILTNHAAMLLGSFNEDADRGFHRKPCPIPGAVGVPIPLGEYEHKLALIFITKRTGIKCEQSTKRPQTSTSPTGALNRH
jgi:hypothetical protein